MDENTMNDEQRASISMKKEILGEK